MDLYYRVYYRVDIHLTWICFVEDGYPVIKRCIPYTYLFLLKPYLKKYFFYFFLFFYFFIILFSYHKYIVNRVFRVVLCSWLNFPFWTLTQTFIKIKVNLCPNVYVHVRKRLNRKCPRTPKIATMVKIPTLRWWRLFNTLFQHLWSL